jgi:hypothetical protein
VQFLTNTYVSNLTNNVVQAAPADILDRLTQGPQALQIQSLQGHWHPLSLRDWDYARRGYPALPQWLAGTNLPVNHFPRDWTWDETTPGQILILPPSPSAVTGGFSLDYIQDPGTLWRLYDDDMALCAVFNGSPVVNLASAMPYPFVAGDVFGVKWNAQDLPNAWYKIAQVNSSQQITLSEPYQDASAAAALFTMSQVSLCEWKRPNLCTNAPVAYALFKYWERENQDRSINYKINFYGGSIPQKGKQPLQIDGEIARVSKACADRSGLVPLERNVVQSYAGMRSRANFGSSGHRR